MFCPERTPAGRAVSSDSQSPLTHGLTESKVRRSIGEWESGKQPCPPTKSSKKPSAQTGLIPDNQSKKLSPPPPLRAKAPSTPQRPKDTARRLSFADSVTPPKPKYTSRAAEAKACLVKAKTLLGNSRNLRSDIKTDVTQAIERLYQLVKEAEGKGYTEKKEVENKKEGKKEKTIEQEILKEVKEIKEIMKQDKEAIGTEVLKLKEEVVKYSERVNDERPSYAEVTGQTMKLVAPAPQTLHSVVIASRDETETGEQVLERIRKVVKAREEGTRIDRIRKGRDGRIVVGCSTLAEIEKVQETVARAGDLTVERVKNKDPLVILRDVLAYNTDEDVVASLRTQNKHIFTDIALEQQRFQIKFRRRTKNPLSCHVVMQVSPQVWQRLTAVEKVHIDLQRVKVEDQSPLVQCSLCLGYGHTRRYCSSTDTKCSHCGGLHLAKDCDHRSRGEAPKCCNCENAKLAAADHSAFSQVCPVRRKWDALARSTTAYC